MDVVYDTVTREGNMTLEDEFREYVVGGDDILAKEYGYNATYFKRMVADHGAVSAAKLLLKSPEAQSGLTRLWELNKLDMSLEQAVYRLKFKELFTDEEREMARKRLKDLGYEAQL